MSFDATSRSNDKLHGKAQGFYAQLIEAGFTHNQVMDLSIKLIDQVTADRDFRESNDIATEIHAK